MTSSKDSGGRRIITKEEAVAAIGPLRDGILDCFRIGMAKWLRLSRIFWMKPHGRTRGNNIWELVTQALRRRFRTKMHWRRGRWLLHVNEELVLVFKRLNRKGLPSNYPTQQALAFANQQISLPDISPSGFRAVLGYTLDATETEAWLEVILPDGPNEVSWRFDLEREHVENVVPLATDRPASKPRRVKVRPEALSQFQFEKTKSES